jgi:acyl carrier protein
MTDTASTRATVLTILSQVLAEPVDELRARPILAAHHWDSLASLEALAQLENAFRITVDLRAYHAVRDVEGLVGLVAQAAAIPAGDR